MKYTPKYGMRPSKKSAYTWEIYDFKTDAFVQGGLNRSEALEFLAYRNYNTETEENS